MPLLGLLNLTVQYMSGRSITLSVEKLHYVMGVIEKVDNDKRLFFQNETQLQHKDIH